MVVEEASARNHYSNFISVLTNHIDVCKPESEKDRGFQHLVRCIKEVVEDVNKNLGNAIDIPGCVVGIENKLQQVRKMMEVHSIVGLVGMGGIGKTTLSKHIYNYEKMRKRFERFSFLEDVKNHSETSLKQLYRDLCGQKWEDADLNMQLKNIERCIVTGKVLLVVDDASEEDLKNLLVHAFKVAKNGSKVIVTTRRQDVLYDYCNGIYDVGLLDENDALKLFSYYAFHEVKDEDRQQLDDQAKNIIKACGKLPLTLEVIGQFLKKYNFLKIGERIGIWQEALQRLREAKSFDGCSDDKKLWGRLKISYDDLAKDEQSMFLDFACIFCEISNTHPYFYVQKDWLARIWDSPIGVQNLINMSLIKWNHDIESLVMHDQLRDMGRRIVKEVGNENMSRIWRKEEALNFTLQNKVSVFTK
jgi:hypothetical protein